MIEYFKTVNGNLTTIDSFQEHCWVSVQQPTHEEIEYLVKTLEINEDFVETSLDENERSHIEVRDGQTLMIFDMPIKANIALEGIPEFYTVPIGFIAKDDIVVSIIPIPTQIIEEIMNSKNIKLDTTNQNNLIFEIVYGISRQFILHLQNIEKIAFRVELQIHKNLKNQELVQLLSLEKSLVYFTNSLKSTEATLEKLLRGRTVPIDDDDSELIEDSLIEIRQSIETANIYTEVLSSTVDAVGSIISNNLNVVMKVLTSLTIVLSIPNMIFGFYGMNVFLSKEPIHFFVPIVITLLFSGFCAWILYINDFF